VKVTITIDNTQATMNEIAEIEERFQQQTLAMATSLVSLIDLRDRYTGGHSQRVASYVVRLRNSWACRRIRCR